MRSTVSGGGTLVLDGINTMSSNFVNTSIGAVSVAKMGHQGATHATSAVVLEGGVLCLSNSVSENVADRLANSAGIALTGGCLAFVHGSGTADYREALGSLTVVENASVVKIMPAAEGQTATLTFASLARSGHGVVDFQGERLGEDGNVCSRILFVTPPALVNGFIGPWATVNGAAPAMYDAARGVYAAPASAYIDIAARGPDSVIPDNPALNARIVTDGISGPIALETEDGAGVFSLAQESVTSAIVSMAGKTLSDSASAIRIRRRDERQLSVPRMYSAPSSGSPGLSSGASCSNAIAR